MFSSKKENKDEHAPFHHSRNPQKTTPVVFFFHQFLHHFPFFRSFFSLRKTPRFFFFFGWIARRKGFLWGFRPFGGSGPRVSNLLSQAGPKTFDDLPKEPILRVGGTHRHSELQGETEFLMSEFLCDEFDG